MDYNEYKVYKDYKWINDFDFCDFDLFTNKVIWIILKIVISMAAQIAVYIILRPTCDYFLLTY